MPREEPFFKKCCFCIPLKSCLQTWACIKAMADIALIVFLILMILLLAIYSHNGIKFDEFNMLHAFFIIILMLGIDFVFMIVLSVGLCKNNLRSLRVSYNYNVYMVVIGAVFVLGVIIFGAIDSRTLGGIEEFSIFVICGIINTSLDICIIFTLKSEMIKMRNKQQFEFAIMPTLNMDEEERPAKIKQKEPFQGDEENLDV